MRETPLSAAHCWQARRCLPGVVRVVLRESVGYHMTQSISEADGAIRFGQIVCSFRTPMNDLTKGQSIKTELALD